MFPYQEQSVSHMVPLLADFQKKRQRCRETHPVTTHLQIHPDVGARVGTGNPSHHDAILTRENAMIIIVTPRIPIRSYGTPIGATYHQGIHTPGPLFMPIRKRPGTSLPYHMKYQARIWFTSALWDLIIELPRTRISRCSEFCTIPAIITAIW